MNKEDLKYYRIINKISNDKTCKESHISEMVRDYNIAIPNIITRFSVMVNTDDGKDVYINDLTIPIRGVIDTRRKQTSTSEMEQTLQVYPKQIKCGDYAKFKMNNNDNLRNYIITSGIEKKNGYDEGVFVICNQILRWMDNGILHEYPCILANNSYGVKVLTDNDFTKSQNIKADIRVQYNEITKNLTPNMRFMFSQSKNDIYSVINVDTAMNKGVITLTTIKGTYQSEDDIDNMIAYNGDTSSVIPIPKPIPTPSIHTIIGADSIKQLVNTTYTISPLIDCKFELDKMDILSASIISDDEHGVCVIKGSKSYGNVDIMLRAKSLDSTILAEKKIMITKK